MIKFILLVACVCIPLTLSLPETRIVGGETARAGQFPFAAAIYINHPAGTFFCSGAIISNLWILTAAQCVALSFSFDIRIGTTKLNEGGTWVSSSHFELAPGWNSETLQNDLGLLRLRMPITFTEYIQPIDFLSDVLLPDNTEVVTFGWGQTNDSVGGLVNDLRYVNLVSLPHEDCDSVFGMQLTENMVCAAGNYNEGICRGDLGSPLIEYDETLGTAHLVGVSSFMSSQGCESTDPSGFTRINPYREWIRNHTDI